MEWMELPSASAIVTLVAIQPKDSGAIFCRKIIPERLGITGGKSPTHAHNSLLDEWVKENTRKNPPWSITPPSRPHQSINQSTR